jgi:N-carbamoyl-L-amino-acid hydrolase
VSAPSVDAERVLADLRELRRRTADEGGARRVCWGPDWRAARDFLAELLIEIGLKPEIDEAGNAWAYLRGEREPALALGSHLDSVPGGGWLDGALGVMAALGVVRAWAEADAAPPRTLALVDWADEEGAAFGRSLVGSSAVSGTLDPAELTDARDRDGRPAAEVLARNGVDLDRVGGAVRRLERIGSYLELHIEQGPILESRGIPVAAVSGCAGVERIGLVFSGQASHAGTTPMDARRDAGLAAAATALRVERIAREAGGVGTTGALRFDPGIVTAVPGEASVSIDLRHPDAEALARMLAAVREAGSQAAAERDCELSERPIWRIEPIGFDPDLVERARRACERVAGEGAVLASGALHDAAEIARRVPAAMIFVASREGISHSREEDSGEAELRAGIEALALLAADRLG